MHKRAPPYPAAGLVDWMPWPWSWSEETDDKERCIIIAALKIIRFLLGFGHMGWLKTLPELASDFPRSGVAQDFNSLEVVAL